MKLNKEKFLLKWVLFFIIFLVTIYRFVYLDRFPVGMSHDELEYILSAKTYFSSGVDLSNTPFPKSIFQTKTEGIISFLPAIFLAPYYGLVPLNQFTARLPYVIISLLTAITLYLITKKLFNNKCVALVTLLLYLINPWSFYLSRTASDTAFSLLFYLLGIFFVLGSSKKKLILSFIFFAFGFFSYHGAKPVLIPLVVICLIYRYFLSKNKLNFKQVGIFLGGIIVVFSFYFLGNFLFPGSINQSRSQDIIFLNQNLVSPIVDTDRKASLENPLKNIFINKATISLRIFTQKYLTTFSQDVLFMSGDARGTYRFGYHGLFFVVDFIFILVGLINLFKKYPTKTKFLLALVIISPLTTAISVVETSVINRSFLLLPLLVIFCAYGILTSYQFISKKTNSVVSFLFLALIVLVSFTNFIHFYFFQFPVIGQENYFFSQRIIANYVERNKSQKMVVVDNEPRETFLEAVFYSPKTQNFVLKDFVKNQNYQLNNSIFTSTCPKIFDKDTVYIIKATFLDCINQEEELKSINEEQFGGQLYYIVNDSLCMTYPSQPWLRFHLVKDYQVEKQNVGEFCTTWIKQSL